MEYTEAARLIQDFGHAENRIAIRGGDSTKALDARERKAIKALLTALMGRAPVEGEITAIVQDLS